MTQKIRGMLSSCCFMTKNDGFIQPRNDRDLKQQIGQLKSTKSMDIRIFTWIHHFFKKWERRDNMAIYLPVQRTPRFEPSVQHKHWGLKLMLMTTVEVQVAYL